MDEKGVGAQIHVGSGNSGKKSEIKRDRTESRLYEKNQTHLECRCYDFAFHSHASFI